MKKTLVVLMFLFISLLLIGCDSYMITADKECMEECYKERDCKVLTFREMFNSSLKECRGFDVDYCYAECD